VLITVTAMAVTPTRAARTFDLSTAAITDINAAFDAGDSAVPGPNCRV
jgi:hypothetical protein